MESEKPAEAHDADDLKQSSIKVEENDYDDLLFQVAPRQDAVTTQETARR